MSMRPVRWVSEGKRRSGLVGDEHVLDAASEQPRDTECQRQAGVVLAGFQGVDRLPGDLQAFGQPALRPAMPVAQCATSMAGRRASWPNAWRRSDEHTPEL